MYRIVFLLMILSMACNVNQSASFGSFERIDPDYDAIVSKESHIEIIAQGFEWTEGPVWVEDKKMLLFSDIPPNSIYKWTKEKGQELYLKPSGYTGTVKRTGEVGSNGLLLDDKNQLLLCQHGDRRIARMNAPLDAPAPDFITLADNYQGKKFDSPNDLVRTSDGDIYFTDPPYGLEKNVDDPLKAAPYQGIYKISKDGSVHLLVDTISRPNGIGFLPGEKTLIVANSDKQKPCWYAFDVTGKDSLSNARIFYDASEAAKTEEGLPDGFKVDKNGNVFATGPGGIWIFDKNAKLLGRIKIPVATSNCALADDDKTLFVTADMYVLKITLRQ
jgi:gluconolactonase